MCCNGTLYGRARLTETEAAGVRDAGLEVESIGDKAYFPQPCRHESCGRCTIYESRFEVCKSFKCAVLRSYHAGEITADDAKAVVAKALELRAAVAETDPEAVVFAVRQTLRRKLQSELAGGEAFDRKANAQRFLNMTALDALLDQRFRNKRSRDGEIADAPDVH